MDIQKEREAFEAWVNSKGRSVLPHAVVIYREV